MAPIVAAILAGLGLVPVAGARADTVQEATGEVAAVPTAGNRAPNPPAGWAPADTADALYREGRLALSEADFRRAAGVFDELVRDHPDSDYAGEALFWKAFSLYRLGGAAELEGALAALERQAEEYPEAADRNDAEALQTRIEGQLAQLGDAGAAERVAERARRLEEDGAAGDRRATAAGEGSGQEGACPERDEVQVAALNALMHMDAERALPILERVLERRDPCAVHLRRQALFLVSRQEGPRTEEILLGVAENDPDGEVRGQAVFWLSQVESDGAVEILERVATGEADPGLQEQALHALARHSHPRAVEILRAYALDPSRSDDLRGQAIFWLGRRDPSEFDFLRQAYDRIESAELRERVLFAVTQGEDEARLEWLLGRAAAEDEPVELRKKALFWAARAGAPIERLGGFYAGMQDPELKEQLIFALSRHDDPGAVARLIEIARTETDPELRKKAIFWLGQADDPRAAEFLVELIER